MEQNTILVIVVISLLGIWYHLFTFNKKFNILEKTVDELESNRYLTYSVSISPHWYSILSYYLDNESDEETKNQIQLAIEDLKNWDDEKEKKYINHLLGKHFSYTHFYSTDWKFSLLRDWTVKWPVENTIRQGQLLKGIISFDSLLYHRCEIAFWHLWFSNQAWNEDVNKDTLLYTFPYSDLAELIRLNRDLCWDKTDDIVSLAKDHWYICIQDEMKINHFEFQNEFVTYWIGVAEMS